MTANKADRRRAVSTEEAVARDRRDRVPIHHEYGSHHEALSYLKRRHRQKAGLMKQFCKTDGPQGTTDAYRDGWDRIFGGPDAVEIMDQVRRERLSDEVLDELRREGEELRRELQERTKPAFQVPMNARFR